MIGVFDSGLGGLTVLKELVRLLPGKDFLYVGDTARTPYGNKSPEVVRAYGREDVQFLLDNGARLVVVACNTVSAVALDDLQSAFPAPIIDVIMPAVAKALTVTRTGRIGVIGTRATVASSVYEKRIKEKLPGAVVLQKACPLLVPLVEENWIDQPETKRILRSYLAPLKAKTVDTLILGCTHYPPLKREITAKMGRRVTIVDSAEETARAVKQYLVENPTLDRQLPSNGKRVYALTDPTAHAHDIAEKWMGEKVTFRKAVLSGAAS